MATKVFGQLWAIAVRSLEERALALTTDSTGSEATVIERALANRVEFDDGDASKLVRMVASHNARQMGTSLGVQIPEIAPRRALALARQTVKTIRGIAGIIAKALAPLVGRSVSDGLRGKEFAAEIQKRAKVTREQAERIAVGQVIRVNSSITQSRHEALGITEYRWRAVSDRNTRAWHSKLDGTIQRYDSAPLGGGGGPKDYGHPGTADVCRCQAIPIIPKRKR